MGDKLRMNAESGVSVLYLLAAIFAVVGGVEWFRYEIKRGNRAKAGLPVRLDDMQTATITTALALILAGSGFMISLLV